MTSKKEDYALEKASLDNEETLEFSQFSIVRDKKFGKKIKKKTTVRETAVKVSLISEVD